ncbi:hypothetical protein SK069_09720 [Patulibacter brassicae]|uniref:Secreted protein n=1 Tax=Patulibacter brassicae TaxID=1705717 RepID=A0ABU4VJ59_9ACTN|nr:hypothetical protein [Patulibacter brassicae]MDX8151870.1 hypothetical protein [Patulibacter brassicae]
MSTAEVLQLAAILVAGIAAVIALFNTTRVITEQRRNARLEAKRGAALDLVEWLDSMTLVLLSLTEHRRSIIAKPAAPQVVRERSEELNGEHRRSIVRAAFLFDDEPDAQRSLGAAHDLFTEAIDILATPLRMSHQRPLDAILGDWDRTVAEARDALRAACKLDSRTTLGLASPADPAQIVANDG